MSDVFLKEDTRRVLAGKHVVLLGGSNIRGLYKDIIWLLNDNSFIPSECLGAKGEAHFPDFTNWRSNENQISPILQSIFDAKHRDTLLNYRGLHSGRSYIEPREYYHEEEDIHLHYLFITRVWSKDLEDWLNTFETRNNGSKIDAILMNSCLWDLTRWGPFGVHEYKDNLNKLLKCLKTCLPQQSQFVWLTSPPVSKDINSKAMQVAGLEFQCKSSHYNVVEANFYTSHIMADNGHHVIDMHYYSLLQSFRRNRDGIHWNPKFNRWLTNLVLTYLSLIFKKPLPNRLKNNFSLEKVKLMAKQKITDKLTSTEVQKKLDELTALAQTLTPRNHQVLSELQKSRPLMQKSKSRGANRVHPYSNKRKSGTDRPAMGQNSGRLRPIEGYQRHISNRDPIPVWADAREVMNMEPTSGVARQQLQLPQPLMNVGWTFNFSMDNPIINPIFRQFMAAIGNLESGPRNGFEGGIRPFDPFLNDYGNLGYYPGQQNNWP